MATISEIDRILTDLADIVEGDTLDEFQATALLQARVILQSLRSQAGESEAVAEIETLLDNCHVVEDIDIAAQHEAVKVIVRSLVAHPAPIEITEKVKIAVSKYVDAMKSSHADGDDGAGYGASGSYFSTLDNLPDFVTASLQGETK